MFKKLFSFVKSLFKKIDFKDVIETLEKNLEEDETPEDTGAAGDQNSESNSPDEVNFSELNFTWGGFHGENAQRVEGCRIAPLSVHENGLSYMWQQGGCENLGAADREDASNTLACLFCLIEGVWKGGKFDWISTSRTTRDFKNIHSGYNGWDKDAIGKASLFAFCIISKDGRKRSNVIVAGK